MKRLPRPRSTALLVAALSLAPFAAGGVARAQKTTGAKQSGLWGNAGTWTNGVPVAGDTTYVGNGNLGGAALGPVTVTLDADRGAGTLYVGNGPSAAGTIDLAGFNLSADYVLLGNSAGSAASIVHTGGTLTVGSNLGIDGGANAATAPFAFAAGDRAAAMSLANGARVTTAATGNLTGSVDLQTGSTLTLGSALTLSNTLTVSGGAAIDAQGRAAAANSISLVGAGGATPLVNRGSVTAGTLQINGIALPLLAGDSVGQFNVVGGATSSVAAANVTQSLNVQNPGSVLTLRTDLDLGPSGQVGVYDSGTLDAAGHAIRAYYVTVAGGSIPNRSSLTTTVLSVSGGAFALTAADAAANFAVFAGGALTTAPTGNVTRVAQVSGAGARLVLGADLSLANQLLVYGGGSVDARGQAVSVVNSVYLDGTAAAPALVNRASLAAPSLQVNGQPFALTSSDSVVAFDLTGGAAGSLGAGASVRSLYVGGGSSATTAGAGNVTQSLTVHDAGSRMTLGAPVSIAGVLTVSGATLDAQGRAVSAGAVEVRNLGTTLPVLANLGTLATTSYYLQSSGSRVDLGAGESLLGRVGLSGLSTLGVRFAAGSAAQLTLTGADAGALGIDPGSHLAFTLDGKQQGVAFRWANPQGGDHVADLNGLIASGAVTIDLTNGAMANVFSQGGYTVLFQPVPEPATVLLASAAGLAGWAARRRIRRRAESPNA